MTSPILTSLSISSGAVGAAVTITGTGFGASQGTQRVELDGVVQTVTSWADTSIGISIAAGSRTGSLRVVRPSDESTSNGLAFAVTQTVDSYAPVWEARVYSNAGALTAVLENVS